MLNALKWVAVFLLFCMLAVGIAMREVGDTKKIRNWGWVLNMLSIAILAAIWRSDIV